MDTSTGMAPFERVAERIRAEIRRGTLKSGDKLPGNRDLAAKYDVALATAQKALRLLQDEGWVVARASVGVFVKAIPDEPVTVETLAQQVRELHATVAELGQRIGKFESKGR
jgi:GntR family transcriptional regulator